ncbi:MAG: 16S rRNA (cytidine(1402)-2'-O)-methyltransferase [Legionellales bacterium]|nr:16S rRNA (cytidine(1402)-2'-O)-methyltransferase [Legionellales bacterium]
MIQSSASTSGTLYVVATPIGNLDDISLRAIQTLKSVDTILCEDTRHSKHLLGYLGIQKPLVALHAHNEHDKSETILQALMAGRSYALISDAGTPLISDPGYPLVHAARQAQIPIIPIPGPCAFITALSAAGVPCDTISYFGFLPAKSKARQEKIASLIDINHTLVFYESTHRIQACLDDCRTIFGEDCELVVAKELTKTYEHFVQGPISTIQAWFQADLAHFKGEFVVIIPPRISKQTNHPGEQILKILLEELPLKQAVNLAAKISNSAKNELYQFALTFKKQVGE